MGLLMSSDRTGEILREAWICRRRRRECGRCCGRERGCGRRCGRERGVLLRASPRPRRSGWSTTSVGVRAARVRSGGLPARALRSPTSSTPPAICGGGVVVGSGVVDDVDWRCGGDGRCGV